ncbi:hypothetical protein [Amycolatopsis suaedae]|uniref:Uncharacterized protein n=1 Tax=Amycolatopsis suaedae TaxID=2510978 RepID=A0A4Q7J6S6_9PSEU|nr:hypothetical protein [Amycolatopsis suaedae]RZQ62033.1 hypothetical protein EWH70_20795 [Amycolatopsis suaedae]
MPVFQEDPGQSSAPPVMPGGAAAFDSNLSKQVAATAGEAKKLVEAAKNGGFKIDPDAIPDLVKALTTMKDKVDKTFRDVQYVAEAPKLGSHAYGQTVAQHNQKGGAGEVGSVKQVLQHFSQVLDDAHFALLRASGKYGDNEDAIRAAMKSPQVVQA